MANRSHLYTCDEVPGGKGFYARGLSEYNWDIPLVHKLMVATSPRIVRSAIWEHDIAILADRVGAFERALAFFDKLGQGDLGDRKEFDEELAQMKEFLATTPPSKFVLLEAGEILDLQGEDLNQLVTNLHAEISELATRASAAVAGQEDAWLAELRADWQEKARPGYWSDILYYSFEGGGGEGASAEGDADGDDSDAEAKNVSDGDARDSGDRADGEGDDDADDETPAAKAKKPAAKKPAAKKPAAKKPAAKKPAAKKPAAKKPAAKKPAAKKPAAKKSAKKPATKKSAAKPAAKKSAKKPAPKKR
jgi:hypothetical protein